MNAFLKEGLEQPKAEEVKDLQYEFKIDDETECEVISKTNVHNEAVSDDEEEMKLSNDPVIAQQEVLI